MNTILEEPTYVNGVLGFCQQKSELDKGVAQKTCAFRQPTTLCETGDDRTKVVFDRQPFTEASIRYF